MNPKVDFNIGECRFHEVQWGQALKSFEATNVKCAPTGAVEMKMN
jgi:hypothetical protein